MIYVFMLFDGDGVAELRQEVRPTHKAYLAQVADRIAFAGPLMSDGTSASGPAMIGSLLAIDFDSREAAIAWIAEEPFTRAGVYARREVHAFQNLWPQKAGFPPVA